MDFPILAALMVVFFVAGLIDSIAGGGGLLTLPGLLVAGVPPQLALGTNKLAASLGTATALANFIRGRMVLWKLALAGLGFSLLGSAIGSRAVLTLDNALLGKLLVALLPLGVAATLFPARLQRGSTQFTSLQLYLLTPVITFVIGFYDGFFGPGTGSFLILGFHFLLGASLVHASATAKVFNLGSNIGSLAVFLLAGQVAFGIALPLAAAGVAGNFTGSRLALRNGSAIVRPFLIVSLLLLLATLVWKYFIAGT